ncbi:type I restriction enzyme S subunit [Blastococcus colisei]|uniref:Type I restriction enzyme S subunit n=1 Tax=Blastococcus colisei TaxID=1564162 RepID=A0A543PJQ6_9ACTN|nr:restriction endonuclease subunit S [Blastococcus colisei]TQN44299.1 type I restriction enzyme S subunit [Blastococcus colisei]
MSEWTTVKLIDIAAAEPSAISKPYGSAILQSDYRLQGIPVVRGVNLAQGRFLDDKFVYIDEAVAARMPGARLRSGDLVVTHRGTIGQVSMIPRRSRFETYAASTSHVKVRLNERRALPEYVYYWFLSPAGRRSILERASTVGVPGIAQPVATIKSLELRLPALPEQRAIAEVLGALDDKIAASAAITEKADALAGTTYESVATENIPLSSLARFVNGKAFTKGASGTGRVVIRIAELNSGLGGSTVYNDIEVADDHVARPGDLLFAWSGSLTAARWFRTEAIINQHIFKVVADRGRPLWLVNQAVRSKLAEFKAIAADKATTMGHIQRRHLEQPVAIPSPEVVERIDGIMTGLWDTALAAELERERLAATRDELLPLLMSGRITVRDAEEVAEAAT